MSKKIKIRIHGDNIVECERSMHLIVESVLGSNAIISFPMGSVLNPTYEAKNDDFILHIQYFPGYGRWEPDILDYIQSKGAVLREAADSVICFFIEEGEGFEKPILAIEFCGALAAGNQAWQRCGRAYAFASAGIPFFYIVEFGGVELDTDRGIRAVRLPNPLVPFSFLLLSEYFKTIVLPIFVASPVTDEATIKRYFNCFGNTELRLIIKNMIMGEDIEENYTKLSNKVLNLVEILSSNRRAKDTLSESKWKEWLEHVKNGKPSHEYIEENPINWSKTAYIDRLTKTAKSIINGSSKYAIGVGSSNIPICLISEDKRFIYAKYVNKIYPNLPADFLEWLKKTGPLGICWVMGFKPRGDDARPDRGLPPLARMILGPEIDILTVVYGPAKNSTWPMLIKDPRGLANQNGLWESIFAMSSALLVDSSTFRINGDKAYLKSHWVASKNSAKEDKAKATKLFPLNIGENDVDTIIHILFTGSNNSSIFEGACNPPGGDWSGISILNATASEEARWISLPRVSGIKHKRPDHIFQLFIKGSSPIILAVESKKSSTLLEKKIGEQLILYIKDLIKSPPSVIREVNSGKWITTHKRVLKSDDYIFVSCGAFIDQGILDYKAIFKKTRTDLLLGVIIDKEQTKIRVVSNSKNGDIVKSFIEGCAKSLKVKVSLIN